MKKPLPKYKQLEHSLILPLSQKQVTYRPYTVADERVLIAAAAARESDPNFYITNTLSVINGAITNDVDIRRLPGIDVRYLLLAQRAKSVGELIEFETEDKKRGTINLDDVKLVNPKTKQDYLIDIGQGLGVKMRDLLFEEEIKFSAVSIPKNPDEATGVQAKIFYDMIISSVESVYDENDAWVVGEDITREEVEEFINDIPTSISSKLYEFASMVPYLEAKAIVDGEEQIITSKEVDFLS